VPGSVFLSEFLFCGSLFDSPVCGNGFVEAGEQCDCGMKGHCDNPCCNASTCMLYSNASCATGECCDLKVRDQLSYAVIRHGSCICLTLKLQIGVEKEIAIGDAVESFIILNNLIFKCAFSFSNL